MIIPTEIVCLIAEFTPTVVVLQLSKTIYNAIAESRLRKCFVKKYPIYCETHSAADLAIEKINQHARRHPNVFIKVPRFVALCRKFCSDTEIIMEPCLGWHHVKTSIKCFNSSEFYLVVTGIVQDDGFRITINTSTDPNVFKFVSIGKNKTKKADWYHRLL